MVGNTTDILGIGYNMQAMARLGRGFRCLQFVYGYADQTGPIR
jgi:hypothetical protein